MYRKERHEANASAPRLLQNSQDQPRQGALVAQESNPARARGQRDHGVGEAQGVKYDPAVADRQGHLPPQIIGEHDEARRGQHEKREGVHIDDRAVKGRPGQQRHYQVKRVPGETSRVSQQIIASPEKMIGDKWEATAEKIFSHFREDGKRAVEIVVGQKKIRTPPFQHRKNQRGSQQAVPQQNKTARLLIDSLSRFWRNHRGSIRAMTRKSQNNLFALPARDLEHILRDAATELEELRGKSLFITGGTGFFGKWLLAALCRADAELGLGMRLTVLSRDPGSFLRRYPETAAVPALRFEQGHVADFPLADHRHDYILHAAADTTAFTTDAEEKERSRAIVAGTRHVLDFARKSSARRMLHVSSGAVYGSFVSQPSGAKEDDYASAEPLIPYGEAKRDAERLCVESGVDFVTARAFAFLGPFLPLDAHFAAGNFLRDARRGGPILVRGDGTALRSYLHPADLVIWLLRILLRGQRARAYNVGSDEVVTIAQLARRIADAVQPTPEVIIQSVQPQGPQNIYLPDIYRARTELNLDVAIPLQDAIARTLTFLEINTLGEKKS